MSGNATKKQLVKKSTKNQSNDTHSYSCFGFYRTFRLYDYRSYKIKEIKETMGNHKKKMEYYKVTGITKEGVALEHYTIGEVNAKSMAAAWNRSENVASASYDRTTEAEYKS